MGASQDPALARVGQAIEARLTGELQLREKPGFGKLHDLRNLAGESTGYVKVLEGERIDKASSVSIDVAPGVRYFNIHIITAADYDTPRYVFEGMLMAHGSQLSADLFPDRDLAMDVDYVVRRLAPLAVIYDAARKDSRLHLEASRLPHMRAFASPFFLLSVRTAADNLPVFEEYATRYFEEWLALYRNPQRLSGSDAAARRERREYMSRKIMEYDPDRHLISRVYGDELTMAIEEGTML